MENQIEVWKVITEFENYQISNLGRVKSLGNNKSRKEKLLKGAVDKNGYISYWLSKNNKLTIKRAHQLVAIEFLNHKPCGMKLVINHKNFIKTDNNIENLEIVTARENSNKKHLKSSSKYTGVCFCKVSKKWKSSIDINRKRKHLGYFINEIDAHNAYQEQLKKI